MYFGKIICSKRLNLPWVVHVAFGCKVSYNLEESWTPNQQPKFDGGFDYINLKLFQQGTMAHMGPACLGFGKRKIIRGTHGNELSFY